MPNEKWEVNRDLSQFNDIAYNGFLYIAVEYENENTSTNGINFIKE